MLGAYVARRERQSLATISDLIQHPCRGGGIGRRSGFKIRR
jgi:hypothetical protein